jgi:predicted transcriptional regulator
MRTGPTVALVSADPDVAARLAQHLERHLSAEPLDRFERVWQLSASQAAAVFGVSRQAYAKWRSGGIPAERRVDVRLTDEATATLLAHVKVDRIPAVVRRPSDSLDGRSLLDVARAHDLRAVRDEVEAVFDLRRVQP